MDYTKLMPITGKYRESKEKSRSRYYILLSIVFVIVLIKWGVPAFIDYVSGPSVSQSNNSEKDVIPPQIPVLSAVPEATNSARFEVQGYTEKEADVELFINDNLVDTKKSDDNGSFVLNGNLEVGSNRLSIKARDTSGNFSQSEDRVITYDNKPVELIIDSPKDGNVYYGSNSQTVDIVGSVNKPDSTVTINGSFAFVSKEGKFNQRYQLTNGENNLKIIVVDRAGNTTEIELKLNFIP